MGNKGLNQFGYNSSRGAEAVVGDKDLSGKHFVITGCTSGIGFETARVLYNRGGVVTMCCRSQQKMDEAKKTIETKLKALQEDQKNKKEGAIQTHVLDLSSLKNVRESAENFRQLENSRFDYLILNAGIMDIPKAHTEDGFEKQMGVNHFGHALFTFLVLPLMNDEDGNRVVVLSSMAHKGGKISFDDMDFKTRKYDGFTAYGQSKLANISFARELNKRLKEQNKKIEAFSVHPGVIKTGLARDSKRAKFFYTVGALFMKSVSQGASTTVFAALEEKLKGLGGSYLADNGIGNEKKGLLNDDINKRFFEVTEQRVGQRFPFPEGGGEEEEEGEEDEEEKVEEKEEEEVVVEEVEEKKEEVEEEKKEEVVEEVEVVVKKKEEVDEEVVEKKEEEVKEEEKKEVEEEVEVEEKVEEEKKEEEVVEEKKEEVVEEEAKEEEEEPKEEEKNVPKEEEVGEVDEI